MSKAFSVASWNVEHFGSSGNRRSIDDIVAYLAAQNADVVGVYEVVSSRVFQPIVDAMPDHHFFISEGPQTQEILVGIRSGLSAYLTQKVEFKSGQPELRPGVLVSITVGETVYCLVFLHIKSSTTPKGFGLRDDMIGRSFGFRKTLDKASLGGRANYIFLGDLNTMGFSYFGKQYDMAGSHEVAELARRAGLPGNRMRLLSKTAPATWSNGSSGRYKPSDLDHVVAADHLQFADQGGAPVAVRGWPEQATVQGQDAWIDKYSDHGLLYFEVMR